MFKITTTNCNGDTVEYELETYALVGKMVANQLKIGREQGDQWHEPDPDKIVKIIVESTRQYPVCTKE